MALNHELSNSNETWAHTTVDMIYGFVPVKNIENERKRMS